MSAATGKPTDDGFHESLTFLLPGDWHNQWKSLYDGEYQRKSNEIQDKNGKGITKEENIKEEQRDIFAKCIFGGMIENMPEHLFLVKCIERLDNLRDREGLKDQEGKGLASYRRTVATTIELYCKRLQGMSLEHNDIGYSLLSGLLIAETVIGIEDIQKSVKTSTTKALESTTST